MKDERMSTGLLKWSRSIDDLPVDDEALRLFAHLLRIYLGRGQEDQEGIASMAAIVVNPDADDDDVQAALDTLRESLHSTAPAFDLDSEDDGTAAWTSRNEKRFPPKDEPTSSEDGSP